MFLLFDNQTLTGNLINFSLYTKLLHHSKLGELVGEDSCVYVQYDRDKGSACVVHSLSLICFTLHIYRKMLSCYILLDSCPWPCCGATCRNYPAPSCKHYDSGLVQSYTFIFCTLTWILFFSVALSFFMCIVVWAFPTFSSVLYFLLNNLSRWVYEVALNGKLHSGYWTVSAE